MAGKGQEDQPTSFLPGMPGLFSFWGNDKESGSYGALQMRRKIAEQLAGQKKGFPKNIGEGLTYLGESIGEAGMMARLEAMERARAGKLAEADRLLGGGDTAPAVATPAARVSEADTGAPAVVVADNAPVTPEQRLSYAPPTTTTEPIVTPPATTVAPPAVQPPPVNDDPAAEQFRQRYLAGRGIAPTATNVPMPPPVQAAAPQNTNPQAEAFRQQFLASPRFNPFADPGAYQRGGEGTTAPVIPPTLEPPPPQTADVPLPRARPTASAAPPTSVSDGGYNYLDAAAGTRDRLHGVDPRLVEIVNRGAQALPEGYTIRATSGHRPGDSGYHGRRMAADFQIIDPDGKAIPNRGRDTTGLYTQLARGAYTYANEAYPELVKANRFAWGGAFDTAKRGGTGNRDLMHFDLGPERGNLDPSLRLSRLGVLPGGPGGGTQVAANPRDAIARTMADRGMQPTSGVSNLAGSQQFGAGDTEAPYGYGPAVKTAQFPPAGAETVPEAGQEARVRDVIGLSRAGARNPATASLGRQGIMSDAPLPGLAPLPSASDAGIAATIEQRNKITDELLQQQPTAPAVPQTDPTQAGTPSSPTIEPPSAASTTSPASPRYAQASFDSRFDVPPSGVLGPQGASPARPPTTLALSAPAPEPAPAPAPAPAAPARPAPVYEPLAKPLSPNDLELPPEANPYLMQRRPKPELPKEPPKTRDEAVAERIYRTTEDPEIQRRALARVNELKTIRDREYARGVEAYKAEMQLHTHAEDRIEKWNADAEKRNTELAKLRNEVRNQVFERQQNTPAPRDTAPGGYDPRLGTAVSPQRKGFPDVPPTPGGLTDKQWAEKQTPELVKATEAYTKAAPAFTEMTQLIKMAREHPGSKSVGALSEIAKKIPGTDAYGFSKIIEQITGKNFLEAYNSLKGGGPITEIEGQKATEARARLQTAQSPEDFNRALLDLENAVRGDHERIQRKLNQPVTAWRLGGDNATYAPDLGQRDTRSLGGGPAVPVEYIGGNPRLDSSYRRLR